MRNWKKWVSIVIFGIFANLLINLVMELVYNNEHTYFVLFENILTILIILILIEGLRIINKQIDKKIAWEEKPFKRFFIQLFLDSVFTLTIASTLGGLVTIYISGSINGTGILIICSVVWVLTLIYVSFEFAVFFLKQWRNSLVLIEKHKKENVEFRFDRLKEQLSPHFLFNNLNTLYGLIDENPSTAKKYLHELSDIYRYVLQNKDNEIVDLEKEVEFIKSYIFLLSKRFGSRIKAEIDISEKFRHSSIPPLTLQLLIENAIKHNIIDESNPLLIKIYLEDDKYIVVENSYQPVNSSEKSGIGLDNLKKRYAFLCDHSIEVFQNEDRFVVKIPLLEVQYIKPL